MNESDFYFMDGQLALVSQVLEGISKRKKEESDGFLLDEHYRKALKAMSKEVLEMRKRMGITYL